jgi:hypothetical protein
MPAAKHKYDRPDVYRPNQSKIRWLENDDLPVYYARPLGYGWLFFPIVTLLLAIVLLLGLDNLLSSMSGRSADLLKVAGVTIITMIIVFTINALVTLERRKHRREIDELKQELRPSSDQVQELGSEQVAHNTDDRPDDPQTTTR